MILLCGHPISTVWKVLTVFFFIQELPVVEPDWDSILHPKQTIPVPIERQGEEEHNDDRQALISFDTAAVYKDLNIVPFFSSVRSSTSCIQATWIGHSSFLVQMEGVNFLTDPVWSDRVSPLGGIGIG